MTLFSTVGFTMLITDCGAQLLAVPVLVQIVFLLDGLPSKAMCPILHMLFTHSWGSGWPPPGRVHTSMSLRAQLLMRDNHVCRLGDGTEGQLTGITEGKKTSRTVKEIALK